jgi:hypothetical protein
MNDESNHHRQPLSDGGDDKSTNISRVDRKKHEAWHTLFQNYDPIHIANLINVYWLDPRYRMEVRKVR